MMVDVFYELSQINSSDNPMIMERQFLEQIVVEAMLMFYNDFEESQLRVHVDEVIPSPILADQKATNRIVTNIIQNDLRYAKSYLKIKIFDVEEYVHLNSVNYVDEFDCIEFKQIF